MAELTQQQMHSLLIEWLSDEANNERIRFNRFLV